MSAVQSAACYLKNPVILRWMINLWVTYQIRNASYLNISPSLQFWVQWQHSHNFTRGWSHHLASIKTTAPPTWWLLCYPSFFWHRKILVIHSNNLYKVWKYVEIWNAWKRWWISDSFSVPQLLFSIAHGNSQPQRKRSLFVEITILHLLVMYW